MVEDAYQTVVKFLQMRRNMLFGSESGSLRWGCCVLVVVAADNCRSKSCGWDLSPAVEAMLQWIDVADNVGEVWVYETESKTGWQVVGGVDGLGYTVACDIYL